MADLGWEIKDGEVLVKWMSMPVAPDNILENVNCGRGSGRSSKRCTCVKAELKCTGLCGCNNRISLISFQCCKPFYPSFMDFLNG